MKTEAIEMPTHIAVCCGTPLIWTFMFSGSEWYCRKCASAYPMMNADREECTEALFEAKETNDAWFRETTKDCIPPSARRRDCAECDAGAGYHLGHATDEEKEKSRIAYLALAEG